MLDDRLTGARARSYPVSAFSPESWEGWGEGGERGVKRSFLVVSVQPLVFWREILCLL